MSTVHGGPGNIVTNGLVLWLDAANPRSYEPPYNGTTWRDLSGNGNTSTLTNGPTYNSSNGGSIVFDGVNDYVATPYNVSLTDFTACAWFRQIGTLIGYQRIMDKSYINGFWIGRNASTPNSWGGGVRESSPPYGRYITLTDGQWHYIVSRRQGTTHTILGDGITNTVSGTVSSTAFNTSALWLGVENPPGVTYFTGNIAQAQIYNRALTDSEILQNFNATRARFGI